MRPQARRVLIVLPDHAHVMDVAGPAQVFVTAAEAGGAYSVSYVAAAPVTATHQGLAVAANTEWPDLDPRDLVIVPGWKTQTTATPLRAGMLDHIARHWHAGGHVASICAGALALAQAGVLDGQGATTHHDLIGDLAGHRGVGVVRDVLYTCADRLHTSAGIASGIDLSLHLVAHDHGAALAARVARALVVPAWRPGASPQSSVMLVHRDHMSDLTHRAQNLLDAHDQQPMSLDRLAERLGVSGRTLARHFTQATGLTPQAYATAARQERATQLRSQGWTQEAAATAVGYADARSLRDRQRQRARSS